MDGHKKKGLLIECLFPFVFLLISLCSIYGKFIDKYIPPLNGYVANLQKSERTLKNIANGSYQKYLGDKWGNSFCGRNVLIRLRGQILYSLFHTSQNANLIIGKDNYIFENQYIFSEMVDSRIADDAWSVTDSRMDDIIAKIVKLKELLSKHGKELYIMISPSKGYFCKDKWPLPFRILEGNLTYFPDHYDKRKSVRFSEKLWNAGIPNLNCTDYIENCNKEINAPVFYPTGVHWAHSWGTLCAIRLLEMISENGRHVFPPISILEEENEIPLWPDADIYGSLNLAVPARKLKISWWEPKVKVEDVFYSDIQIKPTVFFRGCSFMGQSLANVSVSDIFSKVYHYENNYCIIKKLDTNDQEVLMLNSYTDYKELPIDEYLGESDILILETNERALGDISFGFIDYLLEHSDFCDNDY